MGWSATLVILAASAVPPPDPLPASWKEARAFIALFAPADDRAAAYHAYTADVDLDEALRVLADDLTLTRTPGAWVPKTVAPLDVFGRAGRYDRERIMHLYGGRRPRVARGTRRSGDGTIEAWTLISPYPQARLQRLEAGTLLLVFRRAD